MRTKNHGGMTLEYVILSTFTAIMSLVAINMMKQAVEERLRNLSQQLDSELNSTGVEP